MKLRVFQSSLVALSFVLPLAVSAVASAGEACGDVVCPANWECKTETEPCLSVPSDKGDGGEVPECTPSTYSYCSPLPCTEDSQCETDMVCYSETHEECDSAPPCDGSGDCPLPVEPACTNVTESACVPQYALPCEADADCGTGFTCDFEEDCVCGTSGSAGSSGSAGASGSGGTSGNGEKPAPDGGADDPAPPADDSGATPDAGAPEAPECICSKGERKTCSMKVVTCSVDEGCPTAWTCGDNPDRSCWASSDGSSGCSGPEKVCLPPWSDVIRGSHGTNESTVGLGSEPTKGGDDGSGSASGGTTGEGTPPPRSAAGGSSNAAPGSNEEEEGGGCSVARAPNAWNATFGFAALALAGLFGARRRRSH